MNYKERLKYATSVYEAGMERVKTIPVPSTQKFNPGTFVMIAAYLGPSMRHFENNRPAQVEYTYAHAYGGDDTKTYSLLVRYDDGEWSGVAWYNEEQLTEITDPELINQYILEINKGGNNG